MTKPLTKFGSRATITRNLKVAQTVLGEIGYLRYDAAEKYRITNGFAAINRYGNFPYSEAILLFSRGSFLEFRATGDLEVAPVLRDLRANLWVPIRLGLPLEAKPVTEYVSVAEREHLYLLEV